MPPYRLAGVGGGIVGDHLHALRPRGGPPQVQAAQREAGRRHMDVAIHESRGYETTLEVHHLGVGKLPAADVIAAQPRDDLTAHRHSGRVGMGGTVHPAVQQQRGGNRGHTAKLRGAAPKAISSGRTA